MKLIMLFCCFTLCCIFACKKDDDGRDYWGEISVLRNGEPWNAKIVALQNTFSEGKVDIIIKTSTEDDMFLGHINLFKVPKEVGRYKVSHGFNQPPDDSLVGAQYYDGYADELYDVYEIAETDSTSYLEITQYDARKGEIWGKFDLTLYRNHTLVGSYNAPDSLVFTNGTFHTRIDD